MTVKELIRELRLLNPDNIVVLASDGEGNQFSPMDECIATNRAFNEDTGDVLYKKLTPELIKLGYTKDDVGEGFSCIVLYPV